MTTTARNRYLVRVLEEQRREAHYYGFGGMYFVQSPWEPQFDIRVSLGKSHKYDCGVPGCRKKLDSKYGDVCTRHGQERQKVRQDNTRIDLFT